MTAHNTLRTLFSALCALALTHTASADLLLTAGADKKVNVWNPQDGTLIKSVDAHDGTVNQIAIAPNGKLIATAGADKKVKIWNPQDGTLIKSVDAHDAAVTALWFTEDSQKLLTAGADKKVKIWNLKDGKNLASVSAHDATVLGVIWTPQMIITGGADGQIRLWDEAGNMSFELAHDGLSAITASFAAQTLFTADKKGTIRWWKADGSNGDFSGTQGSAITTLTPTPDGKKLLSGGASGSVKIWDVDAAKPLAEINDAHKGAVNAIAITPDGKTIITAGADKKVKIWSADGKLLKTVENAHDGPVTALLYIPDKKETQDKNN